MDEAVAEYNYFLSCNINIPVRLKIERLVGKSPSTGVYPVLLGSGDDEDFRPLPGEPAYDTWYPTPELYIECLLTMDGIPFGLPMRTRLATPVGDSCQWDEWVIMSAKYCDLTSNTQLALTVWDAALPHQEVAVGGCTVPLFTKGQKMRCGRYSQRLWVGKVADGKLPSATPGKVPKHERGEVERFEKLTNRYERGEIPHLDWLDKLTFHAMEKLTDEANQKHKTEHLNLFVELPAFECPVTFQEPGSHGAIQPPPVSQNEIVRVYDPEIEQALNPSEHKQLKLTRTVKWSALDREMKPNLAERREIAGVLSKPSTDPLAPRERQLLWRFRYSLTEDKKALTKFLRCVDWSDAQESRLASDLMVQWAAIDIADALELLSPSFVSEEVRAYAVHALRHADDAELACYLLQLVQALRYQRQDASNLATFLLARAASSFAHLGCHLHWYLLVEWQDQSQFSPRYAQIHQSYVEALLKQPDGESMFDSLGRQNALAAQLAAIVGELRGVRGGAVRKVERLRQLLDAPGGVVDLADEENPLPLPLNPGVCVVGVNPQKSTVFKSALSPLKLSFRVEGGGEVDMIYKKGDDLRQDQLIVQMVLLMDRLLKKENLDLRLTPYRVLATGVDTGLVEYIPSMALAQVLAENKSIVSYLAHCNPDPAGPFGITSDCLETFVKSCAGYCVIMYILGVGDRHLDNLMLCDDGRLFHIDFGFILGRDPKPFPPPMKLCKEMVEAMGGAESAHYLKFKSYCCEAYNILRKSSNLILNLFHLMSGANIPDIAADPQKSILKLQHKFRLDLDDEAAVQFFQSLITESVNALFPQMVETIHRWAQYWR